MRFYTVPNAKGGPPLGAVGHLDHRHLLPVHAGHRLRCRGAAAPGTLSSTNVNDAAPLLAFQIGGTLLLGIIAAIAFATISPWSRV